MSSAYRIGIVSDTHWNRAEQFDPRLEHCLQSVSLILHAGDVVEPFVLQRLNQIAPIRAVQGNCDREALRNVLSSKLELNIDGVRIGLLHGHQGNPANPEEYLELFSTRPHLLVHGHSHLAVNRMVEGVRIFNPGSASEPRNHLGPTVGLLEIDAARGIVSLEHVSLSTGATIDNSPPRGGIDPEEDR
jgi:putative phosphoesterase